MADDIMEYFGTVELTDKEIEDASKPIEQLLGEVIPRAWWDTLKAELLDYHRLIREHREAQTDAEVRVYMIAVEQGIACALGKMSQIQAEAVSAEIDWVTQFIDAGNRTYPPEE
jgi:hypothetical protein